MQLEGRDRFCRHVHADSIFMQALIYWNRQTSVGSRYSVYRDRDRRGPNRHLLGRADRSTELPQHQHQHLQQNKHYQVVGSVVGPSAAHDSDWTDKHSLNFQEPPAARPGPATRHGKEEELSARPDQSKTRSGAAAAAGGAAAAAAAHSKDGNHKQIPAPYHNIPAGVDHNRRNTAAVDGHGQFPTGRTDCDGQTRRIHPGTHEQGVGYRW